MRKFMILITLLTLGVFAITVAGTKTTPVAPEASAGTAHQQPSDVTDGDGNPELIPDRVAYSLLLRLIANRQTIDERGRIRSYIRGMGLGRQSCKGCPKPAGADEAEDDRDIDALIALAEEFHRRVSVLDQQAKEIKLRARTAPEPQVMAQLAQLQRQKEAIVDEVIAALPARLSAGGLESTRRHVNGRVKARIKMDVPSASR